MGKLLIVDDSPLFRKIILAETVQFDFETAEADSIASAEKYLDNNIPDVITLDNELPDGIGLKLCRKLKEDDRFTKTQIVMVTSSINADTRQKSFDAGAVAYFQKDALKNNLGKYLYNLLDPTKQSYFGERKAIIVEDCHVQRKYVKGLLERIGIKVKEFADFNSAAEYFLKCDSKDADVIYMDYNLDKGKTSTQLIDIIRTRRDMDNISIIAMTTPGEDVKMVKRSLFSAGVNDFLEKPFDMEEFYLRMNVHLRNKQMFDMLEKQRSLMEIEATTDHLTRLFNRRYFYKILKIVNEKSKKFKKTFSILIFDIDHFKKVNDNFGHDVGDEVLQGVSTIIKKTVSNYGTAARYGGEEFVVVFPETDKEKAFAIAEVLRKAVEAKKFQSMGRGVTISLGIAESTEDDDFEKLISIADGRLYKAKQSGRNQTFAG